MKRLSYLAAALLLASCAPQPQEPLMVCAPLAINTNNPDFYSALPAAAVESFYNCQLYNLPIQARQAPELRYLSKTELSALQLGLQYQQNLWRRLARKEMLPGAAQQLWLEFANNQNFQRAQLQQATRTADAAEDSLYDNYRSYDRKSSSDKRSSRHETKVHSGPAPDVNGLKNQILGK